MICLASKLPILQVGSHQIADYDTEWLHRALSDGLKKAGMGDEQVAMDLYQGLLHYLQNDCPWSLLKIEDLYLRVQKLLSKVGLQKAKSHLPFYTPDVRISVTQMLDTIECPIELALLQSLNQEITQLKNYGVQRVVLEEIKEAVSSIMPAKRWNKQKQFLHDEIASLTGE